MLLTLIIFLPAIGALLLCLFPRSAAEGIKLFTFGFTIATFAVTAAMAIPATGLFEIGLVQMQQVFRYDWIPSFNINYHLGVDGISFALVILTTFIFVLSMWASWSIREHVKAYCILFLLLETGVLGVFLALDFILFYVFWEVMLLPMYFLIGVWGGPRKLYAAIKFFLYTLLGGVLMIIAILMLYFASDVGELLPAQLQAAHVISADLTGEALSEAVDAIKNAEHPVHTFNLLALQQIGQTTTQFDVLLFEGTFLEHTIQFYAFILLFIGFIIKVPSVPLHTWLPDAHVEAPTPISMILAGILLKLGGYGIIRICYPICPAAGYELMYWVCGIGVVSMIYGALAAMAQRDFKRLVAYSSVSHMGYVVLGLGVWSAVQATGYNADYWALGMNGAMFQMIAHGISSAGMFFMVGVVYDRVHHRNLDEFGGLFARMPTYSGLAFGIFFAGLGLPGLCGFIGELLVTLSVWSFSKTLAVISAFTVILTAAYILWTLQRVYLGAEYKGPHGEALTPITPRELGIAAPILAFAILLGVYPRAVLDYMEPSVTNTANVLAEWTKQNKPDVTEAVAAESPAHALANRAEERIQQ
jgi:NADH-quinone oxidoreductase subunit M